MEKIVIIMETFRKLTPDNYYSNTANELYRSKSQYWEFQQCEARALAQLRGKYTPNRSQTPLLFGNYLHSFFESYQAHKDFVNEHQKELFSRGNKKNGLKKVYSQADKCIKALIHDEGFKNAYIGEKEAIVTGDIDNVPWMGKIDCLDLDDGVFFDLKTVDDIHKKHWNNEKHEYVNFAIDCGYDLQMAIYQELIYQTYGIKCTPIIIAVSKQEVPDKDIFTVNQFRLDDCMDDLRQHQQHMQQVINGESKPIACGECDYCRLHKKLGRIHDIQDIRLD